MLDITFIKENLEICKAAAIHKNRVVDWDRLLILDEERRKHIGEIDIIRAKRNQINSLPVKEARIEGTKIKATLKEKEDTLRVVEEELHSLLLTVPNIPDKSVPIGKNDKDNVEIRKWGTPRVFDFPIEDHIDIAKRLDLIDFERGSKVGGFRAYFLKNEAVLLELGVLWYSLQKLVAKGFTPLIAPSLVREFTLFGNAQFPWGRDEVYALPKDELYLSGTAEIPVTAYFSDEVLKESDLPKKFVAYSPCFRRESGSYGKDTKGVYRVHQFNKIEQVIVAKNDTNTSLTLLEELLANSEEILQDLELPYRVLSMCTGDMGEPQVKKYDIETWLPKRENYGETMSDSFMGDFQARRLNIRYKNAEGKMMFCHTLNNTAIASPRIIVSILENFQQKDGSIAVPKVLQTFVGKEKIMR